jgi:ATP/maltotriose-dependent transcriptional regulator MalT
MKAAMLLQSKMRLPGSPAHLVLHSALQARLTAPGRQLLFVHGPAGSALASLSLAYFSLRRALR